MIFNYSRPVASTHVKNEYLEVGDKRHCHESRLIAESCEETTWAFLEKGARVGWRGEWDGTIAHS